MFRALRALEEGEPAAIVEMGETDLEPGEVAVAVEYSSINYKDALAATGTGKIVRAFPCTLGIDLAGTVEESADARFGRGDRVVCTGWGLGENRDGGLAGWARVPGEWLVGLPEEMSTQQAAAIGTAGFTAMLAVEALERAGVTPGSGDVVVTGACGGAGSLAVALLAHLGYRVVASTGRLDEAGYLERLGASAVIDRSTLSAPGRPLGTQLFAGGIDGVGSHTLANVLAQTAVGGTVAAYGLAQGIELPATVAPFILRGVTLVGINSVTVARPERIVTWGRLASDLDPDLLAAMTTTVALDDVLEVAGRLLAGRIRGRTVVEIAT